jgi:hypothetical protein
MPKPAPVSPIVALLTVPELALRAVPRLIPVTPLLPIPHTRHMPLLHVLLPAHATRMAIVIPGVPVPRLIIPALVLLSPSA